MLLLLVGCVRQSEMPTDDADKAEPLVTVTPDSAVSGDEVRIDASGFEGSTEVVVGVGPPESEYEIVERVATDDTGGVSTSVTVPDWLEAHRSYVWVVAEPDNSPRAVSDRFLVLPASPGAPDEGRE